MTDQNTGAAPGSKTFVHATVMSCMFNAQLPKRDGGTYLGVMLNFMDTQGQNSTQKWAQTYIDDARNLALKNVLASLVPNTQITIHKTKGEKYWDVTSIAPGHVEGERTSAPAAPGAPAPTGGGYQANDSSKMRSKEQCIRGEAIQAACTLEAGETGDTDIKRIVARAESLAKYITQGTGEPALLASAPAAVVAPPAPIAAAPVPAIAAPAPAGAPTTVGAAPIPTIPGAVGAAPAPVIAPIAQAPAPAPAAPEVTAAPPGAVAAPATAAQPAAFDDGFGG